MSLPRVLFISHSSDMLGAERSLLASVEQLRSSLDVSVLCPGPGPLVDSLRKLDVSVHTHALPWWLARRNSWPMFLARAAQAVKAHHALVRRIESLGPDVVYTNSLVTPTAAIAAKRLQLPHIWHVRELVARNDSLRGPISEAHIYRRVQAWSTAVGCNSPAVQSVLNLHGIDACVLPNPVSVPLPATASERLSGPTPHLLVVGTLSDAKGQRVAIESLRYFPRHIVPTLHLVGSGSTRYVAFLKKHASDLGFHDRVAFHGLQERTAGFYEQADLIVVPSAAEAFGRTAVEALLLRKKVIGSDSGGLIDLIPKDARFTPGDPQALAAAAVRALTASGHQPDDARLLSRHEPAFAARLQLEFILATLERPRP